jgi:hypothetical protein
MVAQGRSIALSDEVPHVADSSAAKVRNSNDGSNVGESDLPKDKNIATFVLTSNGTQDDSLSRNLTIEIEGSVRGIINRPANKDDVLTHTIHLEDDINLNALTFRTFFLGRRLFVIYRV